MTFPTHAECVLTGTEVLPEIANLYHLIDTICDQQYEAGDRSRIDALLWIARDQAKKCKELMEAVNG